MNRLEEKMSEILLDLKNNYNVKAVKAEFGEEGSSFEEINYLKKFLDSVNIDLTVKIGGCEALNDMRAADIIKANSIVAPMIESSYALKKFVKLATPLFLGHKDKNIKLFANIETITGYMNLDEILSTNEANLLTGIVLGRSDMAYSLGLKCSDVNSDKIFQIADTISEKTKNYNKNLIIGGAVSKTSIEFLKQILTRNLAGFETRKILFDASLLHKSNIETGLKKALEFEILWLNNKNNVFKNLSNEDNHRLEILERRYNELL